MPVRRYRGQRVRFYYLKDRRGRYLVDPDARPRLWLEHGNRLAFPTRNAAERAITRYFVCRAAATELLGLRVVTE